MNATAAELAQLTSPALEGTGHVLLVPIGATEQHGPHLPLGTDTAVAVALSEIVAGRRDGVVVAPAIPYGSSGEHRGFPGTLSIGQRAIELLLVELCRSACETFARVVLVSAHGGNAEPLQRALATLRAEGRAVRVFAPRWTGDAHAGQTETSLMLAIAPHLVRSEHAQAGDTRPLEQLIGALRAHGIRGVSPNGVLGDPGGAGPERGRALLEAAATELAAMLEEWS